MWSSIELVALGVVFSAETLPPPLVRKSFSLTRRGNKCSESWIVLQHKALVLVSAPVCSVGRKVKVFSPYVERSLPDFHGVKAF